MSVYLLAFFSLVAVLFVMLLVYELLPPHISDSAIGKACFHLVLVLATAADVAITAVAILRANWQT